MPNSADLIQLYNTLVELPSDNTQSPLPVQALSFSPLTYYLLALFPTSLNMSPLQESPVQQFFQYATSTDSQRKQVEFVLEHAHALWYDHFMK